MHQGLMSRVRFQLPLTSVLWTTAPWTSVSTLEYLRLLCVHLVLAFPIVNFPSGTGGMEGEERVDIPRSRRTLFYCSSFLEHSVFFPALALQLYVINSRKLASRVTTFCQKFTFSQMGNYF